MIVTFFDVNTNYIPSIVFKIFVISQVRSTSKMSDISTHSMKYFWYLPKKRKLFFLFTIFCQVEITENGAHQN